MTDQNKSSMTVFIADLIILSLSGMLGSLSAGIALEWIGLSTRSIFFPFLLLLLFLPLFSIYLFIISIPFQRTDYFIGIGRKIFAGIKTKF
jgi:hypothetical protein